MPPLVYAGRGATPAALVLCDPTDYCPGCNTFVGCRCPPADYEDALYEAAYVLGYGHGLADGPENRPTRCWLEEADLRGAPLDPDGYLGGYDDACAGRPSAFPEPSGLPETRAGGVSSEGFELPV